MAIGGEPIVEVPMMISADPSITLGSIQPEDDLIVMVMIIMMTIMMSVRMMGMRIKASS